MSVRAKLLSIIAVVALVPVAVSALVALRIHREAYEREVAARQRTTADMIALHTRRLLEEISQRLGAVALPIEWGQLSADEIDGALWLIYQQLDQVAAVGLRDGDGNTLSWGAYAPQPSDSRQTRGHPAASQETLAAAVAAAAAASQARASGSGEIVVSPAFADPEGDRVLIAVGVSVAGPGKSPWQVVVGVALAQLCGELAAIGGSGMSTRLLDERHREICGADAGATLRAVEPGLADQLVDAMTTPVRFRDRSGVAQLAAVAPVDRGWVAAVHQPAAEVEAPGRAMLRLTIYWVVVSVLVAAAAGLHLARAIHRPVARLTAGAGAIAGGDLTHRVDGVGDGGRDELVALARAFNHMAGELERRTAEIQAFNEELQERVEARTRELKAAQQQLLESQKIAAVTSLAAGIAHEINNPLTGILGLAQVLRADDADGESPRSKALAQIETEAKRVGEIIQTLLTMAQERAGEGFAEVDVGEVAREAAALVAARVEELSLALTVDVEADVPPISGRAGELRQAFLHLLVNAMAATEAGGQISITVRGVEGELVQVVVADTGKGISPAQRARIFEPFYTSKADWQGRGLGLSVTYRTVEEHRGKIEVDSEVGRGTAIRIILPAAVGGAHLV